MIHVSKERLAELIRKVIKLAYDDNISPNTLFTPETIGATPEEFDAFNELLDRIDPKDKTNAQP
jgi:hypothetical protein